MKNESKIIDTLIDAAFHVLSNDSGIANNWGPETDSEALHNRENLQARFRKILRSAYWAERSRRMRAAKRSAAL